ncbi:MAG: RagB/SusD family nutrient uptake outer membrane protein [Bacteroidales bacterium]|nr:RagB/SusD family nutrient uptake outer membrane protein [Bacteroidales bacterium]MBN2699095.1 RagB/SusD family nutrient uptake outer membrane protein [Bacteroidales bacterium]
MKKSRIYNLFTVGLLSSFLLFLGSCEIDDFLEKPAGGDVTIDTLFSNIENAQQLIFSLYHDSYFGANNIVLHWWDEPQGWGSWSEIGEDIYFPEFFTTKAYVDGTFNPTSGHLYPVTLLFDAVRKCNIFIERANTIPASSPLEAEYIRYMIGEAHVHMAYQYFKGFRLWGSLPWINKALEGGEEPYPRMDFSDLVDSMVMRLDLAADMLPVQWDAQWTGRLTRAAARALKAKILVYAASPLYNGPVPPYASGYEHPEVLGYGNYDAERWKRAADACKEAIQAATEAGHSLYTSSGPNENLYYLAINLTNEHIIYQRFRPSTNVEGSWAYCYNMMNWPYGIGWHLRTDVTYQPTIQHVDGYQMKNGKFPIEGYNNGNPLEPVISAAGIAENYDDQTYWKDRDPRFYNNIVYHGSTFGESYNSKLVNFDKNPAVPDRTHGDWPGFKTSFMVHKFVNEELGASSSVTYQPVHPIIRLADLYLLYAEALSEYNEGPDAEALTYFNLIRSRSGMPDYDAENYTGSSAREKFHHAIKYERKVEFFMEGQRYFDLRRWKEGDELNLDMAGIQVYNDVVSRININWTNVFPDRMYFHPFYTDWVNNTPGLYQNPGY